MNCVQHSVDRAAEFGGWASTRPFQLARRAPTHRPQSAFRPATMPKEMTASEEYTRAQEQTSLERVFNNLDKKGDGKVRRSDNT